MLNLRRAATQAASRTKPGRGAHGPSLTGRYVRKMVNTYTDRNATGRHQQSRPLIKGRCICLWVGCVGEMGFECVWVG